MKNIVCLPLSVISAYLVAHSYSSPVVDVQRNEGYHRGIALALAAEFPKTTKHTTWSDDRRENAVCQMVLRELGFYIGAIDGLIGPASLYAIELWQNHMRGVDADERVSNALLWPTYNDLENFYGKPGENIISQKLPYGFRLAWDTDIVVHTIQINKICAPSAMAVLEQVKEDYGLSTLRDYGLDLYGGCFNNRNMRGGSRKSVHAYGAAIDFDPEHNQLRWGADKARFDGIVYAKWWKRWEDAGWTSLGRKRNYDWMHVQACAL